MPKKMAEINVEKASRILLHHIIACVAISNTHNIGRNALTSGAFNKILVILLSNHCHFLFLHLPFIFNILQYRIFLIWSSPVPPLTILLMYARELLRVIHEFYIPDHVPGLNDFISNHLHIEAILHPQPIHQLEHL